MQWYYSSNGAQQGPVSEDELRSKIASGAVQPTDLAWREGMSDWTAVGKLPELNPAPAFTAAPPSQVGTMPVFEGEATPYQTPQAPPAATPVAGTLPVDGGGKATASLVLGICGIVFSCIPCLGLILGILAVVFGNQTIEAAKMRAELAPILGKAKTGKLLGFIAIGLSILSMVAGIVLRMSGYEIPQANP